ncbi:hypothetical protein I4U23_029527 [Adineta vaga]|nr:hypothetical protein I4U23_029527 [Adineta vaga]
MLSLDTLQVEDDSKVWKSIRYIKFIIPILGIGILLAAFIFILSIITLVKVNKKIDAIQNYKQRSMINFKEQQHSSDTILASSIRIEEVMSHLNELQRIATVSNGTRAINTLGFNDTLDYIRNYLTANTNFKVQQSFFPLMNFALAQHPILISSVDDVMKNYTYASNISDADFYHAKYSTSINTSEFTPLAAIPNYGCLDDDWRKANPSTAGRVALVKRGFLSSIRIEEVMSHLNELQRIANISNGTRAVSTVTRTLFTVIQKRLARSPILLTSINGTSTNHTYSNNLSISEFYYIEYTTSIQFTNPIELTVIPNLGCSDNDWRRANPLPAGRVALVKRGDCTFVEKSILATKYKVTGLLIYNDGTSDDRRSPIFTALGENNTLPALFLSFQLGQKLADAAQRKAGSVRILMNIKQSHDSPFLSECIIVFHMLDDSLKAMSNDDYPFKCLSQEARELYLESSISRINVPSALTFYRDYVSRNKPVIIQGALNDWLALSKWTNSDYLRKQLGNQSVTIDITPDGYGDSVKLHKYFVTPLEEKMPFNHFMDIIEGKISYQGIVYCQHQNSSFTTEFQQLNNDIHELNWVRDAFGQPPDAVNLWIGTSKSVSTLHHDPYENLYGVIQGRKHFTLYPPTDLYWLDQKFYKKAHYERYNSTQTTIDDDGLNLKSDDDFVIVPDDNEVPWFDHDENQLRKKQYLNPLRVSVEPGEVLYLPSLWFHRVEQDSPVTIACNFWYDMEYDIKWNYYQFMSNIIKQKHR